MYTRTSLRQIRSLNVLNDMSFYTLYIVIMMVSGAICAVSRTQV